MQRFQRSNQHRLLMCGSTATKKCTLYETRLYIVRYTYILYIYIVCNSFDSMILLTIGHVKMSNNLCT